MTNPVPAAASPRANVLELDVLRGVAAILMIVNHAGYRLLSAADAASGMTGLAVFLGSFAPVVFFFATGFGIGLGVAATNRAPALGATLWKAALLILADQIGYWASGDAGGLNFFSFIGIAMLVVGILARLQRSTAVSLALVLVLLIGRYALGPVLRDQPGGWAGFDWIIGARNVPVAAYPLSPWMVYPLLGFALGKLYATSSPVHWLRTGTVVIVAAGAAAAALVAMKSSLFRWGTVSAAFFVLSIAVLAAAGLVSMLLTMKAPRVASAVALRGVASFAVIPLHYALLDACRVIELPLAPVPFVLVFAAIALVSWIGATAIAAWVAQPWVTRRRSTAFAVLAGAVVVLVWVGLAAPRGVGAAIALVLAQLAIAGLLGLRARPEAQRIVTMTRV